MSLDLVDALAAQAVLRVADEALLHEADGLARRAMCKADRVAKLGGRRLPLLRTRQDAADVRQVCILIGRDKG